MLQHRTSNKPILYLASQSPRRKALLGRLRRPFQIVRSTHREVIRRNLSPSVNAMRNAIGKARRAKLPHSATGLVIGADTFLYVRRKFAGANFRIRGQGVGCYGYVIGKPKTMREAHRLLRVLSGKSHWVYTGLCLRDAASGCERASFDKTQVTFKRLPPEAITRLFRRASPLDLAGGYAIQHDRGELIARIKGSRSNVIGLPLELLRRELQQFRPQASDDRPEELDPAVAVCGVRPAA